MEANTNPVRYLLQGKAGETAVATQLMLRGVVPYIPLADVGVDLLTERACRIQVKSARLCCTPLALKKNLEGVYRFSFSTKRYRASSNRGVVTEVRYIPRKELLEYCDVVVFWGIDQNRFWVVPAGLLEGMTAVQLGPTNERSFSKDVNKMREMIADGYTHQEVAEELDISVASVSIRLARAGTKIYVSEPTFAIRQCENAWHHIIDFDKTLRVEPASEPKPAAVEQVISALEKE